MCLCGLEDQFYKDWRLWRIVEGCATVVDRQGAGVDPRSSHMVFLFVGSFTIAVDIIGVPLSLLLLLTRRRCSASDIIVVVATTAVFALNETS